MSGLRERIAAKQRRTMLLPIRVADPAQALGEADTFRAALRIHQQQVAGRRDAGTEPTDADAAEEERLRQQLRDANDRAAACVVQVELRNLPGDEWDAVFGPLEPDASGELDLSDIHAVALAASCTDPDLQDEAWWEEQFARKDIWSKGDRATITAVLLELNVAPPPRVPGKD